MNDVKSEINVTPLVDVVLVLLIIFMVVMPMMTTHGVNLPHTKQPVKDRHTSPHKTIYLTASDSLFYEEEPVLPQTLEARLQELQQREPQTRILLHADRSLKYEQVMEVMSLISGTGFDEVGLLAQPVRE